MEEFKCIVANISDIEKRWNKLIKMHDNDNSWIKYKENSINCFKDKTRIIYYGILNNEIICEATAIISLKDKEIQNKEILIKDNFMVYLTAFRTDKQYENNGYFSKLYHYMENDLINRGYKRLSLGVEPSETRNIQIYTHLGYINLIGNKYETYIEKDGVSKSKYLVKYYYKDL